MFCIILCILTKKKFIVFLVNSIEKKRAKNYNIRNDKKIERGENMSKGRVTIPTDENFVEGTKKVAELWGADAVRDCDGTHLPKNALDIAEKVYNTYFVVRGDNEWADKHTDELQSVLLMTNYKLATSNELIIDLLEGYSREQLGVNE